MLACHHIPYKNIGFLSNTNTKLVICAKFNMLYTPNLRNMKICLQRVVIIKNWLVKIVIVNYIIFISRIQLLLGSKPVLIL